MVSWLNHASGMYVQSYEIRHVLSSKNCAYKHVYVKLTAVHAEDVHKSVCAILATRDEPCSQTKIL